MDGKLNLENKISSGDLLYGAFFLTLVLGAMGVVYAFDLSQAPFVK